MAAQELAPKKHPPRLSARAIVQTLSLGVAMLAGSAGAALAQQAAGPAMPMGEPELTYEQIAFDAADTNGDGLVSEGELARDAAVGFATLDKDGSMTLTPAELGPHDPALFARIDTNHDGVLSFTEVMVNKTRAFKEGDKNKDGGLSFEEMVEIVELEQGGGS